MAGEDGLDIGEEESKVGSKKKTLLIIAILVLVLAGGGVGAYLFLFSDPGEVESPEEALAKMPSTYLSLDPVFVVDFLVEGKQRFIQLNMSIKSKNAEQMSAVTLHMPLIRNSLVLLLSSQSFSDLQLEEGKIALKQASLDAINGILEQETGQRGIDGVLFTNFVMQ